MEVQNQVAYKKGESI